MAFTPRLTSQGMQGNPWWYSNGNPFYAANYGLPNCTCYAYGRYAEIRNAFASLPTGNAGTWYASATNFNRGSVPQLGAVACYGSRTNRAGHVAIVEVINQDGSIKTSNSAYQGTYFWVDNATVANNYMPTWMINDGDYYFQGFIYNDAIGGSIASKYVVAAMCGCFYIESGVNPGIWESLIVEPWDYVYDPNDPNKGGYGLGQWTNTDGPQGRLWQLHSWVNSNGYTDGDGDGQLAFLVHENNWADSSLTRGNYHTLTEFLQTDSTNLADLVWDFLANWERVPGASYQQRLDAAQNFLAYINAHETDDPSAYYWTSANAYITNQQTLYNVMRIYFWFSNGIQPPVPPVRRTKMPVWMLIRYFQY